MMRIKVNGTGLALMLLAVVGIGAAAYAESTEDAAAPGPAVGTEAPAFVLRNQADEDVSLAQLVSSDNVALVFFRSADW